MKRRHGVTLFALALLIGAALLLLQRPLERPSPVRIGVLHSLSGAMAISERPLVDALRLAAEEINAEGGVLGRPLELVVADSRSDAAPTPLPQRRRRSG